MVKDQRVILRNQRKIYRLVLPWNYRVEGGEQVWVDADLSDASRTNVL